MGNRASLWFLTFTHCSSFSSFSLPVVHLFHLIIWVNHDERTKWGNHGSETEVEREEQETNVGFTRLSHSTHTLVSFFTLHLCTHLHVLYVSLRSLGSINKRRVKCMNKVKEWNETQQTFCPFPRFPRSSYRFVVVSFNSFYHFILLLMKGERKRKRMN